MDRSDIRVLVVDDDGAVRRNIEKALRQEGYLVETAVDSLNALEKIQGAHPHLAILDLKMPDLDGKMSDRGGIDLLRWIKDHHPEIFVILLTGAGTVQTTKEALKVGATDYLEKDQLSPADLRRKVRDAIRINFDLRINYGIGTSLQKAEDEEVLRRLFLDSSEINVSLLAPGSKAAAIYRVSSRDLEGRWRVPFATKIGWKDQILAEEQNFQKWVKHRLGGSRYADIIGQAVYTSKRGGVRMAFLNTNLEGLRDFRTFFHTSDVATILGAMSNLFENTLSYWYQSKEFETLLLVREYANYLEVDKWDLNRYMNRYHLGEFVGVSPIYLAELDASFHNPVASFERLLRLPEDLEKRTYVSTVHGDLHASNILVDEQNNCWLVDFSRTGRAHVLRDFVELETAIKFNVLQTDNLRDLCDLESCLMSQKTFSEKLEFSHPDEEIQKAFEVIRSLRRYASLAVLPSNDMSEYYIGLVFHSLNMLRFLPETVSLTKKKCILFSASLIFEQLKHAGFQLS